MSANLAYPLFLIFQCYTAMLQAPAPSTTQSCSDTHMQVRFRGLSLACLLWLAHVCLFIACLNVFSCLVFSVCPPICVELFNKPCEQSAAQVLLLIYMKLMEDKAPNMEDFHSQSGPVTCCCAKSLLVLLGLTSSHHLTHPHRAASS